MLAKVILCNAELPVVFPHAGKEALVLALHLYAEGHGNVTGGESVPEPCRDPHVHGLLAMNRKHRCGPAQSHCSSQGG